jgi:hypothetical protein
MRIKKFSGILFLLFVLLYFVPLVFAQESEDGNYLVGSFELEKLIALLNGLISTFLFALAFISYKKSGKKRLFYVGVAFLLFAVKSFLIASELFFAEVEWFDPLSTVLEFAVLLSFFFGVLRK